MLDIRNKINSLNNALINIDYKIILIFMITGILIYFGTIFFVFIPTEAILNQQGYSIFDFQMSWFNQDTDTILRNWSGVLDVVIYQTLMDFLFIIGTMMFLGSIYILLIKLTTFQPLRSTLFFGFWFVDIGALSDGIENILSLMILLNPQNYPKLFEFWLTFFATLKFLILPIEYGILILSILLIIGEKIKEN